MDITKEEYDRQVRNAYLQGQKIGYKQGYDDGYDDGQNGYESIYDEVIMGYNGYNS